ncbi:MAG: NAD(P)-dependent dehydrogenase (short-subunit alcohol dehydrogenase family) [Ilumatobacter sp.]|jgi:3-oxoacyl-[acyl-carrier protein] reductase
MPVDGADARVLARWLGRQHGGRRGAVVAVDSATNEAAANEVFDALPGEGHVALPADLGAGGARGLVESTIDRLGKIDVVVNNAAIDEAHPVVTTSPEEWDASWA